MIKSLPMGKIIALIGIFVKKGCGGIKKIAFLRSSRNFGEDPDKCFTCVSKTIANLATYRRKPENYNGTIIFEFDTMKNSSPLNQNLCQT